MKKNLLLMLVSMSTTVFAADLGRTAFVIDSCDGAVGFNNCKMKTEGSGGATYPSSSGKSQVEIASAGIAAGGAGIAALLAEDKTSALLKPKNVQGSYNSRVPGGNPFTFCSGGRPSRKNPLRPIYDAICPAGNVSPEQAAQKNGLTEHLQDAQSLSSELTKYGTSTMLGIGLSEAAKNTLGGTQDANGNSLSINNNMSYSDYNRQVYNQIQQEGYLRQQEEIKAMQDPEYVKKVIPDSNAYQPSQAIINNQKLAIEQLNREAQAGLTGLQSLNATQSLTAEQIQAANSNVNAATSVQKSVTGVTSATQGSSQSSFTNAFK